jgi:hypothetical protein
LSIQQRQDTPSPTTWFIAIFQRQPICGRQIQQLRAGADPIAPAEKVVNFVGELALRTRHFGRTISRPDFGGLLERRILIVVAMNKQHWRSPVCEACDW